PTSAIQSYHQTQLRTATILVQTRQNTKSLQTQLIVRIPQKGKILTVGVPDKQKSRAHSPGNVSLAKCRSILPLPAPAENQTTRQPPLCRYPADGSRFVPERRYLRAPAGRPPPACWYRVPADRWRRNAAWCAGGIPQGIRFYRTTAADGG